ncbi:tlp protein [Thysanoplusia orichalcea nucleopolyhedrovirus]|uniref:Tlp protein n=1 Tax=Thysanoplusia orichalcea nucleopolyhedrovirus TaxID=101850 RepID=L0CLN3_9ABAC|nr:tlp protein [Thysanoplusia orichalcea nucleopolyhedrovirus]AGA16233.1 tlp protein [Thysanoplusia orichalcea nucleopolyhedrovirus]
MSSTTPDIIVNAQFNSSDINILDFIIEDEYYLKKRGVGAHVIKVASSPQLKPLYKNAYSTVSCGNYGILCNLVQNGEYDLTAIMFNCAEIKLNKGDVLFQIKIWQSDNSKTDVVAHASSPKRKQLIVGSVENGDDDAAAVVKSDEQNGDDDGVGFDLEKNIDDGDSPTPKKQKLDSVEQN